MSEGVRAALKNKETGFPKPKQRTSVDKMLFPWTVTEVSD